MTPIARCSSEGCGLRIGYQLANGSALCWLHAEQQKLPVHLEWLREFGRFVQGSGLRLGAAATKRDNGGNLQLEKSTKLTKVFAPNAIDEADL